VTYRVKELFLTLQGEGANAGRTAVFCRFAGCNLWTGQERHRATAVCRFCDTDFVGTDGPGGGRFATADALADAVAAAWPTRLEAPGDRSDPGRGLVVCTGGEPLLQLDPALIEALHQRGLTVAIETNGTLAVPTGVDWVCVSPKAGSELVVEAGDELKLVVPQVGIDPSDYEHLAFDHFLVQPMDGPDLAANTQVAVAWCLTHPRWRLSVQAHKLIGIP
jgi:7-carboxy-7-deazaguanine synthase